MTPAQASDPNHAQERTPGNRLGSELSPYLLQHADNPVHWFPWGEEAFALAAREDKPIFLSIGYATCHWCHVMAHESFEDPEVARLMNETFINIKVDREERPDVDQVYMSVCQILTGSGGWPLTIIMTPEKKPFFAGTYLPKTSRQGRMGMLELIPRVQQTWSERRDEITRSSEQIVGHLRATASPKAGKSAGGDVAKAAYQQLRGRFDRTHGGFGTAPKFPSPHNLVFLVQYWRATGETEALSMVEKTLEAMRMGGIYDHIGFGFHRYSTDPEWLVPHFEKMLYDQAMMVSAYTEAYQVTRRDEYEQVVSEVIEYVTRDMSSPAGGFFSAEDADSEGVEGKFYVWSWEEVGEILNAKEAAFARDLWSLSVEGNFADEASGRRTGTNIPHLEQPHADVARRLGLSYKAFEERLTSVRKSLFEVREQRIHPLLDDKILTDWNGLMIAAVARAGAVFQRPDWIAAARRAADFVLAEMRGADGRLMHRYRNGSVSVAAFLDDYAFLTWGLLELYDATLEPDLLVQATALQEQTIEHFWDESSAGFYFTADDAEDLLVRQKEIYDGAIPSGNSVAMANLVRLNRLTGRTELAERADELHQAFASQVEKAASAHTRMVSAVLSAQGTGIEVVVAGTPGAEDTEALIAAYRTHDLPNAVLLLVPEGPDGKSIRAVAPFAEGYAPVDGKAAAYLCRDFTCQLPTTDPKELDTMLGEAEAPRRKGG